jgi:hypothetical protein
VSAETPGFIETLRRIRRGNRTFEQWRRSNPGGTFADWYVVKNLRKIEAGAMQPNLGPRVCPYHVRSARGTLKRLRQFGLRPQHRLLDYGCGSLRVGQHVIPYLESGGYWGLDVRPDFAELGLAALGPALVAERRPRVGVLDDATVREARAWQPDFVLCLGVLFHIHPDQLASAASRLAALTTPTTQTLIRIRVWWGPTVQTSPEAWLHSSRKVLRLFKDRGCITDLLPMDIRRVEGLGLPYGDGWLRLRRRSPSAD